MVKSTKTFRVFVSSTFSDMKEERNALQKEVFPKLRKLCMEHGFRFQAIDLRWGVSEEAGLDQETMKICLEEIERSQRVSPKPNFIVLLGDRYGWRPLPYEIPADEFEEIKSVIKDKNDCKFFFWEGDVLEDEQLKKREGWYCRDENAIPPVYCLKPRLVDYDDNASDDEIKEARDLEYKDWEDVEKRLKSILLNAIDELGWDKNDSRRFKYESSATEQEIIKGVLKLPEDGSLSEKHVFSFMRTIKDKKHISFDDNSKDFFDFTAMGTIDAFAEEKLIALKDKIDDKLSSSNIFDYEIEWEGKCASKQHIEKLCEDVYSSLKKVITEQINEYEEKDHLDMEIEAHKEFGEERCKFFKGRKDSLAQIKNYLENPNLKPLIICGESGSGKSALMAKAVEDSFNNFYQTEDNKFLYKEGVIVRFIGSTPESSDIRLLLMSLSQQISKIYNVDSFNIPKGYHDLKNDFKERLCLSTGDKPLFIFLDALDQISDFQKDLDISWLPDELPKNVHIIISTQKELFLKSIENNTISENAIEVKSLKKSEGESILFSWLIQDNVSRKLTTEQQLEVINKFEINGLPLYLKLAFEEAKNWKSYTETPNLEPDVLGITSQMFNRLSAPERHGEILFSHAMAYLSAARNGLAEDELLDILALDEEVFNLTKKFHLPSEEKLPVALWSRLYFDIEPYLTEKSVDKILLLSFFHLQIGEIVKEEYLKGNVIKIRHRVIAKYFLNQAYSVIDGTWGSETILKYEKIGPNTTIGTFKEIPRFASELMFHLKSAGMWNEIVQCLEDSRIFSFLKESTYGVDYEKGIYNVDHDALNPDDLSKIHSEQRSNIGYAIANALGEHARSLIKVAYTFEQPWPATAQKLRESDPLEFARYRDNFYSFIRLSERSSHFARAAFDNSKNDFEKLNDFLTKNSDISSFSHYLFHFGHGETGLSHAIEDQASIYVWEELNKLKNEHQMLEEQKKSRWKFWKK